MQSPPALQTSPEGLRSAAVNVNIALLRSRDNSRFSLLLPDGNTVNVTKSTETRTPAGLVWHGKIVNQPTSSVSFSIVNETAVGSILTGRGQSFRLRRDASGVQVIEEVDLSKLPPEGDPTPVPGRRGDKGGDSAGDIDPHSSESKRAARAFLAADLGHREQGKPKPAFGCKT